MGRTLEDINADINQTKYDMSFEIEKLEDLKRRYELFREKIWIDYRRDSDEISAKKSDIAENLNYYENEIEARKEKIRRLEGRDNEYEQDRNEARRDIDRMRGDDIPDSMQAYDFIQKERAAEEAERRASMNRDEIRRLQDEIDEFTRRYEAKERDLGMLDGKKIDRRQERKDTLFQNKVYFADLADAPRGRLRELKAQLESLKTELREYVPEKEEKKNEDSYGKYLEDTYFVEDSASVDEEEDRREYSRTLSVGSNVNLFKHVSNVDFSQRQEVNIPSHFADHHQALESYAIKKDRTYTVHPARSGFRASVGRTLYSYRHEGELTVSRQVAVKDAGPGGYQDPIPSIEDFMVILNVERKKGRTSVNLGNIESSEYRARLLIACKQAGLRPRGDVNIPNLDELSPHTREEYEQLPSARKNLLKIASLKQKGKQSAVSGNKETEQQMLMQAACGRQAVH